MTSVPEAERERTEEKPYAEADPKDVGPWYKCPTCDVCISKRNKFLVHLSSHGQEAEKAGSGGHRKTTVESKIDPENKPIFHTEDG